ncbi:hypothetical protein Emag_007049 [Eimeria magna]
MGVPSRAPNRFIQMREPSSLSQYSFLPVNVAAARQELGSTFHSSTLPPRGARGFKSALAVIASAAALALLIAVCAAAYFRAAPLQLTRRRLSEGGPSPSAKGLATCGETIGSGSGDDPQASLQEKELGSPPAKKTKVGDEGPEADAAADLQGHTSGSGQEEPASAGGAAFAAPRTESSLVSVISPEEVIAAESLIALWDTLASAPQQQAAAGTVFQGQAQSPSAPQQHSQIPPVPQQRAATATSHAFESPPPLPSAALLSKPTVVSTSTPASAEAPQPQPAPIQPAEPRPGPSRTVPLRKSRPEAFWGSRVKIVSTDGLEVIDPMGKWEPPPLMEAGGDAVVEHAFSKLPRVEGNDPSAYSSFFNPQRAISITGRPVVQMSALRTLRALFARDELSRSDLEQLGMMAEHLVNHLAFHEGRRLSDCPALAVETLGFRFVILDFTVSSLQLLGVPPRGTWWEHVVSRIADDYDRPLRGLTNSLAVFNFKLLYRLQKAIRVLKAGHRLEPKVAVHLKRCLFCCKHSPLRFLKPGWDRWREADKFFYRQFEGRPAQSDPVQPGPSHQSSS